MEQPTQTEIDDRLIILNRCHQNALMAVTAQDKMMTQRARNDALAWFAKRNLSLALVKASNEAHYIIAPPIVL